MLNNSSYNVVLVKEKELNRKKQFSKPNLKLKRIEGVKNDPQLIQLKSVIVISTNDFTAIRTNFNVIAHVFVAITVLSSIF